MFAEDEARLQVYVDDPCTAWMGVGGAAGGESCHLGALVAVPWATPCVAQYPLAPDCQGRFKVPGSKRILSHPVRGSTGVVQYPPANGGS